MAYFAKRKLPRLWFEFTHFYRLYEKEYKFLLMPTCLPFLTVLSFFTSFSLHDL